jgi:hypothetical protein
MNILEIMKKLGILDFSFEILKILSKDLLNSLLEFLPKYSSSSSSSSSSTNSSNLFSDIYCKINIIACILRVFFFFNEVYIEQVSIDGLKKMMMMKEGMINIFFELLSNSIKFLKKTEKYYELYNPGIPNLAKIKFGKNNNENYYHYIIYDNFTVLMRFIYLLFD